MKTNEDKAKNRIIDCDVHVFPASDEEIKKFLPQPWKDRYHKLGRTYNHPISANRHDALPSINKAGTDPYYVRLQHVDEYSIDTLILLPRAFVNHHPDPDFATAVAAAYNDWLAETWLGKYNHDGIFKGSITIAPQDPEAAAKEIDRWAGHPHFVQVMTDSGSQAPFGQRRFYPIYEACERNGFPFAIHPGTDGAGINHQPTPGYPTRYLEWHTNLSLAFQAHLVSFLTEGVFVRFPNFKVVLVEGGAAWLPTLMWRLDAEFKGCRIEVPWLTKCPSEYLREHVRFTSQPLERPDNDKHLLQIFEMMDAEHLLMFSSDYPHWDFDSPTRAFPKMPEELRRRIMFENAMEFYRL